MSEYPFSPKTQAKVDCINSKIDAAEKRLVAYRKEVNEAMCLDSPIKPGHIISWNTGNMNGDKPLRKFIGKVLSVCHTYRGYEYRCHVLNNKREPAGHAIVSSERFPTLESQP